MVGERQRYLDLDRLDAVEARGTGEGDHRIATRIIRVIVDTLKGDKRRRTRRRRRRRRRRGEVGVTSLVKMEMFSVVVS